MKRNCIDNVAIVHYWFDNYRGGEKVIEALCEMFPDADIYTHIYKPEDLPETITRHKVFTTFISKLPFAKTCYRYYLPIMPLALKFLNLNKYDLIISSESGPTKGIRKRKNATHICYCHSPMRYIWDMQKEYVKNKSLLFRGLWTLIACCMRSWDKLSARKVDYFISNSRFISARIRKFYKRSATVIHPPVQINEFEPTQQRMNYYLCASQLVPYKKVEIVVRAFNKLNLPLCVIGEGDEFKKIKKISKNNIQVLGRVSNAVLQEKLEKCKAFVYAGKEDFGIVLAEALSAGAPIIAYGKGGVKDIVQNGKTGLFFGDQTQESIIEAVRSFEDGKMKYLPSIQIARHSEKFSKKNFKKNFDSFLSHIKG